MKKNRKKKKEATYQLSGWILFILCALCYLTASIKSRDYLTFFGSLIFLIACFLFLIPLLESIRHTPEDSKEYPDRPELVKQTEANRGQAE
jgi:hypothetical protein